MFSWKIWEVQGEILRGFWNEHLSYKFLVKTNFHLATEHHYILCLDIWPIPLPFPILLLLRPSTPKTASVGKSQHGIYAINFPLDERMPSQHRQTQEKQYWFFLDWLHLEVEVWFDCRVLRTFYRWLLKLQTDATVVLLLFVSASPIL